jgi:hypothetical protein
MKDAPQAAASVTETCPVRVRRFPVAAAVGSIRPCI